MGERFSRKGRIRKGFDEFKVSVLVSLYDRILKRSGFKAEGRKLLLVILLLRDEKNKKNKKGFSGVCFSYSFYKNKWI